MIVEIKPCPFCGCTEISFSVDEEDQGYMYCGFCAARGPLIEDGLGIYDTKEYSLDGWNERVTQVTGKAKGD